MKKLLQKSLMTLAMFGMITLGLSVYTSQPAQAFACPYGPNISVGRNYMENGNIVGYWYCGCNGVGSLVWGRYTSQYNQFVTGFCAN